MQVTVVGDRGFVGSAMTRAFEKGGLDVNKIDKKNTPAAVNEGYVNALQSDVVFVCVPTPYDPATRQYNTDAVCEVLNRFAACKPEDKPLICLRSTVAPDFFDQGRGLVDVYHPEFLRAKFADNDFRNPDVHVYGVGQNTGDTVIRDIYRACKIEPKTEIVTTKDVAALLKLIHNVHRALRVSFLNELYVAAGGRNGWAQLKPALSKLFEARAMGGSYMDVPGPDGKFGFGGGCFPKDLAAFIGFLARHGRPHEILDAVVSVNSKMRLPA